MAAPSGIRSGVGFRHCQILEIAADDYPAASDTNAYSGVTISGVRALTITDPEPRNITHQGDDTVFALDVLPPTEPVTGEMRTGKTNDAVDAITAGINQVTIGEAVFFGIGTDQRGNEAQVIMLAYRQTLETDPDNANFGSRRWDFRIFPKVILTTREGSYDENPEERLYTVTPQFVTQYPWGTSFTSATEGFCRAQIIRGGSQYQPKLIAFQGDASQETFAFPTAFPAITTAKIDGVWVDGTVQEETTDYTTTTTTIIFTTAPAAAANIVVFYEHNVAC
jgi:hypothetical protein